MYQDKTDRYDYWHAGSLMVFHYHNPVMKRWGLCPLSLGRWVIWFR